MKGFDGIPTPVMHPDRINRALAQCEKERDALDAREQRLLAGLKIAQERMAAIRSMRARGCSYREIGDKFGITAQRVYQLLKFDAK